MASIAELFNYSTFVCQKLLFTTLYTSIYFTKSDIEKTAMVSSKWKITMIPHEALRVNALLLESLLMVTLVSSGFALVSSWCSFISLSTFFFSTCHLPVPPGLLLRGVCSASNGGLYLQNHFRCITALAFSLWCAVLVCVFITGGKVFFLLAVPRYL